MADETIIERDEKGRFIRGNTVGRNGGGRRDPGRSLLAALKRLAAERINATEGGRQVEMTRLEALARVAWNKAIGGDLRFAKEVLDRICGETAEAAGAGDEDMSASLPGLSCEDLENLAELKGGPKE